MAAWICWCKGYHAFMSYIVYIAAEIRWNVYCLLIFPWKNSFPICKFSPKGRIANELQWPHRDYFSCLATKLTINIIRCCIVLKFGVEGYWSSTVKIQRCWFVLKDVWQWSIMPFYNKIIWKITASYVLKLGDNNLLFFNYKNGMLFCVVLKVGRQ